MTTRRGAGDGGLYWVESRKRWIAQASVGYDPSGRRLLSRASGKTKTEAKEKLKVLLADHKDGLTMGSPGYTVADAVNDWLQYGLTGLDEATKTKNAGLCRVHIIPALGRRKLRDLSAEDVDKWLAGLAKKLSTSTIKSVRGCLNRSINRAMARDKVKRNVVPLCVIPTGLDGRKSKALTFAQAESVLAAIEATGSRLRAYIIVSLLIGARTEELRALTWDHVDLVGDLTQVPVIPPHVEVWRSVRAGGDTKTKKSRRTIALPERCMTALQWQREQQAIEREQAGPLWTDHGLVFASTTGTPMDHANVRRDFRAAIKGSLVNPSDWTPREMRHSFVSLLSDSGLPLEVISQLVGHKSTVVTEIVYRQQIRPVLQNGAVAMNDIFAKPEVGHRDVTATTHEYSGEVEPE